MNEKNFYFETNALYSIGKISNEIIQQSYTSAFAIFELISGLDAKNFSKRKKIIEFIRTKKIVVDWRMPEQIISLNFNALNKLQFKDHRIIALIRLVISIGKFSSLSEVIDEDKREATEFGFEHFKKVDDSINRSFVDTTILGHQNLKRTFEENPDQEPLIVKDKAYKIDTHESLSNLFISEPGMNIGLSVWAIAEELMKNHPIEQEGITHEMMWNSYNHYSEKFIIGYTQRITRYMIEKNFPKKNDINDLLHLLYLSHEANAKIVSNDKIYDSVSPGLRISVEALK